MGPTIGPLNCTIGTLDQPLIHWTRRSTTGPLDQVTDHDTVGPTIENWNQALVHWTEDQPLENWTTEATIDPLDRPLDHLIEPVGQPLDHWTDHWTIGPTIGPFDRPLHHWIHHWNIGPTIRPSDRAFDHWTNQDLWPTIGRLDQPLDHWIDHWTTGQNIEPIEQNHRNFDFEIMQSIIIKRSQLLVPRPIEHRIACPIDPALVHYLQKRCKPNKWKTHRKHRS